MPRRFAAPHPRALLALAGLALGACAGPYSETPTRRAADANLAPPPAALVAALPAAAIAAPVAPAAAPAAPSAASAAMRAYYAQLETQLVSQGLLRLDIAPKDAPFGARELARDFLRIALYDEYANTEGALVASERPSRLRRWEAPVRMAIEFGPSVPEAQRAADRAEISAYAGRLGRVSGHPVQAVGDHGNFTVLVLGEDERRAAGDRLARLVPGVSGGVIEAIRALPPSSYCVVYTFSDGASPVLSRAVAVIRAEHPARLRRSCIHEELAQGLGLGNDSPQARPSIFNDDEEFALLTRHDELLLKILYDERLSAGMREAEARPVVEAIAAGLAGGES